MLYPFLKAMLSGVIIMVVSEVAKRSPALGALIVSLPLVSILAILWLWHDTGDRVRVAAQAEATFWYVLPTLPMFLVLPMLLRQGIGFWPALGGVCFMTFVLYLVSVWLAARFGVNL